MRRLRLAQVLGSFSSFSTSPSHGLQVLRTSQVQCPLGWNLVFFTLLQPKGKKWLRGNSSSVRDVDSEVAPLLSRHTTTRIRPTSPSGVSKG